MREIIVVCGSFPAVLITIEIFLNIMIYRGENLAW